MTLTRTALAVAASTAATGLWFALAWRSPTSTYHFAPIVGAAVGPYVTRTKFGPTTLTAAVRVAALGAAITIAAALVLWSQDRMLGPTFWSEDGAVVESLAFALLGAVVGAVLLTERDSPAKDPATS